LPTLTASPHRGPQRQRLRPQHRGAARRVPEPACAAAASDTEQQRLGTRGRGVSGGCADDAGGEEGGGETERWGGRGAGAGDGGVWPEQAREREYGRLGAVFPCESGGEGGADGAEWDTAGGDCGFVEGGAGEV